MKKNQVVASLAAVSVMGVVAPLASTASAWNVTNNQIGSASGDATCGELTRAIDFLDSQSGYTWFDELDAANAKTTAGDYADITDGANLYNGISNYGPITFGSTNQYEIDFENSVKSIKTSVVLTDGAGNAINQNSIAAVRSMVAAVEGNGFYQKIRQIVIDLNSSADAATLYGHVESFKNSGLPGAANLPLVMNSIIADYTGGAAIDALYGAGAYNYFSRLVTRMDQVSPELQKAIDGKAAYAGLIEGRNILDPTNLGLFNAKNVDTNPTVVTNLKNLANRTAAYTPEVQAWNTIRSDINTLTHDAAGNTIAACTEDTPYATNFGNIWGLATNYKAASGSDKDIEAVAEELINYVALDDKPGDDTPENPDGPTEPGISGGIGGSDGKGEGNTTPGGAAATIVNSAKVPNAGAIVSEGATAASTSALSILILTLTVAGLGCTIANRSKKEA